MAKIYSYFDNNYQVGPQVGADDTRWVAIRDGETAYFCGRDVAIYFGDHYVDDIVDLHFTVQEAVLPFFSYAARIWSGVTRGQRQISGAFTVNFKDSGYLFNILEKLRTGKEVPTAPAAPKPYTPMRLAPTQEEIGMALISAGVGMKPLEMAGVLTSLKSEFWERKSAQKTSLGTKLNPVGNSPALSGPYAGFPIRIVFGQPHVSRAWGTIRGIVGVQLTGFSQSIEESGKPILEQYSFAARDLALEGQ